MKKFRPVQIQSICIQQIKGDPNGKNLLWVRWKTLWEKKKMLVTSNSFFYHNVFNMFFLQGH